MFATLCLSSSLGLSAQNETETSTKRAWQPEWGVGLWSELQTVSPTSADDDWCYNFVNLLRWNVGLPISRGWSLQVAALSTAMTADESLGRERQTFSNLDAGNVPFALSVGGFQWENSSMKADDSRNLHTFFLGVRNMNEDYFASPVTGFFTNSTWGIYPTLSCNMDIANYPNASVGVHYRYEWKNEKLRTKTENKNLGSEAVQNPKPQSSFVLQASLYNGTGYSHLWGRENVFRVCPKSDGVFGLMDMEYHRGESSYYVGTSVRKQHGQSACATPWIYTEQHIIGSLSLLAGYSHAFGKEVDCKDFAGVGLHYALPKAELGVFTDYARFSNLNEWATELSCKVNIVPHISLQPAIHIIASDGFQAAGVVRLGVEF